MATREEITSVLRNGTAARRAGRLDEAPGYMREAAALCGPDQLLDLAYVLRELGELARNQHDLDAAQAHYRDAIFLLRNADSPLKLAHSIRHLGDIYRELRQYPEAEKCYVEALDIYRGHPSPDTLDLANAIRAHAVLKSAAGDHEGARPLWTEAAQIYERLGLAAGVEECRRHAA